MSPAPTWVFQVTTVRSGPTRCEGGAKASMTAGPTPAHQRSSEARSEEPAGSVHITGIVELGTVARHPPATAADWPEGEQTAAVTTSTAAEQQTRKRLRIGLSGDGA